ncbi:MAG: DUF3592 domain-containing protein [Candidatus Thalassarchaeaceae archaeon]|nr:DUF3592 domain-containing protein [Candidatus Thalassarchaeaceae archaeon]
MSPPDDEDDYESGFSFEGLTGIEEEEPDQPTPDIDIEDMLPPDDDYEPGQGTWVGLAVFWVFTLIWCAVSFGFTGLIVGDIQADIDAESWPTVEGYIIDSGVYEEYDDEGDSTYCPWIEYGYTIENVTYTNNRISHAADSGSCNSWYNDWADDYPPGENITVYVNPEEPQDSQIETGMMTDPFLLCFACFPLVGLVLLIFCCVATYNSIMHPEKYIVGNFVPGDTSDSDSEPNSGEGPDSDRHPIDWREPPTDDNTIQIGGIKITTSIIISVVVLLLGNVFGIAALTSDPAYADDFAVANEAMEETTDWPTTTGLFSDNFTFWWDYETGEDYFSGSIFIYCTESLEFNWECGENESESERIEIPYRCTETEEVGPLENPCDWAMKMLVVDAYHWEKDIDWFTYEQCEWEGHPEDDNRWSCYYDYDGTTEYEAWWWYCEHRANQTIWRCTDDFGPWESSPENQNETRFFVETTLNYDTESPTRIAFVEHYYWNSDFDGMGFSPMIPILIIMNLVIIGSIVVPIVRKNRG